MNSVYTLNLNSTDLSGFAAAPFSFAPMTRNAANVAGFATAGVPGFAAPDPGTFETYRRISAHPTVALAMRIVTGPIIANGWGGAKRRDVPEQWLAFVRDMLQPMRARVLEHALRALVFGFSGFEKVWEVDGGRLRIAHLKPLYADITQILVDDAGNFAGFRQKMPNEATQRDVLGSKAF